MTVHDARRTCATLLVDLEVHQPVIMRIGRHADVSMTLEIDLNARADGAARSAAQAEGSPSMRRSNLVVVAVLAVFLLLYWQQRGPHHFWCRDDLLEYRSG
jgi:hypothetical protein